MARLEHHTACSGSRYLLVEDLGELVLGEMKDLEPRVAGNDPHHRVGERVAADEELLDFVEVHVRVERREVGQTVLCQVQRAKSAATQPPSKFNLISSTPGPFIPTAKVGHSSLLPATPFPFPFPSLP